MGDRREVESLRESYPDSVKLFVGQIPRTATEEEVRELFAQYGNIIEIVLIRDRMTRAPRGCAFVSFEKKAEADTAIAKLHGQHTMTGMSNPVQCKYADGESERLEHKLFVGMLPRTVFEDEVRPLFEPYGKIEELLVLRGPDRTSRGCAFVKYAEKSEALAAIAALNGQKKLEGSPGSLVVKFADTHKKRTDFGGGMGRGMSYPGMMPMYPGMGMQGMQPQMYMMQPPMAAGQAYAYSAQQYPAGYAGMMSAAARQGRGPPMMVQQPAQPGLSVVDGSSSAAGSGAATESGAMPPGAAGVRALPQQVAPQSAGSAVAGTPGAAAAAQPQMYYADATGTLYAAQYSAPYSQAQPVSPGVYGAVMQQMGAGSAPRAVGAGGKRQPEGPPGANLFIMHLPSEWTDSDLHQTFQAYGNVVSAHIFVDTMTNESKCFGFVSYDKPESAEVAISQMNGFQIGGKRLRVQLKSAGRNRPY